MPDTGNEAAPARWFVGPPPPFSITLVARLLELCTFLLTLIWVYNNLGGLAFRPTQLEKGGNDTGVIFNWHPLLMSLAFPVFMAEAVLAYRVPLAPELDRGQRKLLHAGLHTAAIIAIIGAVIAAWESHTLKLPAPIPNLYSPHSWLGLFTFILSLLQYLVGLGGFLWPKLSGRQRAALSPVHVFLGKIVFVLGLATMAVGIQEKTTFVQFMKKPMLYSSSFRIPAALVLLLALTGIFVLYHHAPPAVAARKPEDDGGLLEDELRDPSEL